MFLPLIMFVALFSVPLIISWILIRSVSVDETLAQAHVPASYWGKYAGAVEAPHLGTITLHDPISDGYSPTNLPPHAVPWHP